jgi:hypothetical protein
MAAVFCVKVGTPFVAFMEKCITASYIKIYNCQTAWNLLLLVPQRMDYMSNIKKYQWHAQQYFWPCTTCDSASFSYQNSAAADSSVILSMHVTGLPLNNNQNQISLKKKKKKVFTFRCTLVISYITQTTINGSSNGMLKQTVMVDKFYHIMTHSSYFCYHKPRLGQPVMSKSLYPETQ